MITSQWNAGMLPLYPTPTQHNVLRPLLRLQGEGPVLFKSGPSSYFLLASHLTLWAPNPPQLFAAAAESLPQAKWHRLSTPAAGEQAPLFWLEKQAHTGTGAHA